jgi:hypothetical protein
MLAFIGMPEAFERAIGVAPTTLDDSARTSVRLTIDSNTVAGCAYQKFYTA